MLQQLSPTRRDVLKSGGALVVTFSLAGRLSPAFAEAAPGKTVAPTKSTASQPSMPKAPSPSIPARSISAPACARR